MQFSEVGLCHTHPTAVNNLIIITQMKRNDAHMLQDIFLLVTKKEILMTSQLKTTSR
jgi:hypothetical protein